MISYLEISHEFQLVTRKQKMEFFVISKEEIGI